MFDLSVKHNSSADVVVVGGGVIGLTIARALAQRGLRKVILIERGQPGSEASWAAGGILAPQIEADCANDFFRLACASRDIYPAFAQRLSEETGMDLHFDQQGTLYLAFTEADETELRRTCTWQSRNGFAVEWLKADEAQKLEPKISPAIRCALRFPDDWQIDNRRLVSALIEANKKLCVRLIANCEVTSVRTKARAVSGIETSSGSISSPLVILAGGAWTSSISVQGISPPQLRIEPVRGQMLCFRPADAVTRHVLFSSSGYLVPRCDGRLLAGSTAEHVGFDKRVTSEGIAVINSLARQIVPELQQLPLTDSWAGFRPCAPDGLPVIGPSERVEGLIYATGHYRNGILLAPITGELIAAIVTSAVAPRELKSFSPDRFESLKAMPAA